MFAKKIQDIIPPRKGGPLPKRRSAPLAKADVAAKEEEKVGGSMKGVGREALTFWEKKRKEHNLFLETKTPKKRVTYLLIGGILTIFLVLAILFVSSEKTTLLLTPKQISAPISETFFAHKVGNEDEDKEAAPLSFDVITITDRETKTISATNVKQIDRRSSGQVVVYNNFSSQSQRLIKNTRFEASDGLVFRIQESVVVPGQKKIGGEIIPGSLEVTVYADEPGEKYNIGLRDFTIPGFRGTPRYEAFYARSKTEMTGGFSGPVKTVSENILKETEDELRSRVEQKLLSTVAGKVPEGYVLYPDAVFINFPRQKIPPEQANINEDSVDIAVEAVLYGILFHKDTLGNIIAHKIFSDLSESSYVLIRNIEDLSFALLDKVNIDPTKIEKITFTLKGNPAFEWQFDEAKLKQILLKKDKDELKIILRDFPSIVRAEVTLRPFWKSSFPENLDDIVVEKVLEE